MIRKSGVSRRLGGLILMLGVYLIGIGYLLNAANSTSLLPELYWNRFNFYVVLGGFLIAVYTWINFKPKEITLDQYPYHNYDTEDVPNTLYGSLLWGSGRLGNKSTLKEGEEPSEPSKEYWERKKKEYEEKTA